MEKIVVCYKWVMDERDISVGDDGKLLTRQPSYKIGLYDKNAIEAAMQLSEATGAEVIALTVGDEKCEKSRKEVLAMGPAEGRAVVDAALDGADGLVTADVLAAAIRNLGEVGVVVCAEGSEDMYNQQVGPRLAAALGFPFVGYATKVAADGGAIAIERDSSGGTEVLSVAAPLVVSIAGDSNVPRIAGIKDIMKSGKKPFEKLALTDLGFDASIAEAGFKQVGAVGNRPDRKNIAIGGTPAEIADGVVKALIGEGVL